MFMYIFKLVQEWIKIKLSLPLLKKCGTLQKIPHIWKSVPHLKKCGIRQKIRHIWKSVPHLKKSAAHLEKCAARDKRCKTRQKIRHIWKRVPHLKKCGALGKMRHIRKSTAHFEKKSENTPYAFTTLNLSLFVLFFDVNQAFKLFSLLTKAYYSF